MVKGEVVEGRWKVRKRGDVQKQELMHRLSITWTSNDRWTNYYNLKTRQDRNTIIHVFAFFSFYSPKANSSNHTAITSGYDSNITPMIIIHIIHTPFQHTHMPPLNPHIGLEPLCFLLPVRAPSTQYTHASPRTLFGVPLNLLYKLSRDENGRKRCLNGMFWASDKT